MLDKLYPQQYGFAALRCAIDNLNGDNVEWIAYPAGARHVLCYAYYVQPPPTSGTIIVKKVVAGGTSQSFRFTGNISYAADHSFSLAAGASQTFFRAAGSTPWTFTEQVPAGWALDGVVCTSAKGTSTSTVTGAATSVVLAASDTVTCTYTNRLVPPPGGLVLSKRTLGGVDAFRFSVGTQTQTITTRLEDAPVAGPPLSLDAGTYTVSETLPDDSPAGRWERVEALCGSTAFGAVEPVRVTIPSGGGAACEFTNRFIHGGSLRVFKSTIGATGTARFQIERGDAHYQQRARTRRSRGCASWPAATTRASSSSAPTASSSSARRATAAGHWELVSVLCDGRPVASAQGRTSVRLTEDDPHQDCTFVDRFTRDPEPPNPTLPPDRQADADAGPGSHAGPRRRRRPRRLRDVRRPQRGAARDQVRVARPRSARAAGEVHDHGGQQRPRHRLRRGCHRGPRGGHRPPEAAHHAREMRGRPPGALLDRDAAAESAGGDHGHGHRRRAGSQDEPGGGRQLDR